MIYITGDTHGKIDKSRASWLKSNLTKNDILIICGDFGASWNADTIDKWNLFEKDYTVLFCDGNHENYKVMETFPKKQMFGDWVQVFGNNTYRLLTGHMYLIEGKKFFIFGGASSLPFDKAQRLADEKKLGINRVYWWEEETPTEEQYEFAKKTLKDNNYTFDYFISHTCRGDLKDVVLNSYKRDFYDPTESMIQGLEYEITTNGGSWKKSFFGHFHKNVIYDKYVCLYYNIYSIDNDCIDYNFDYYLC